MATQELTYRGRKIIVDVVGDRARMTIDGKTIPIGYDSQSGTAIALQHMPYKSYSSLILLAKGVVDKVINK